MKRGLPRRAFDTKYVPVPESGCWLWLGAQTDRPYGLIWTPRPNRRVILAHRFSWELFNGPVPLGINVLHKCDVTLCVNPDHLFLGTQLDNVRDMMAKGRRCPTNPAWGKHGNHAKGEASANAKLTSAQVLNIRKLYNTKVVSCIAELARRFHISESQTSRIVKHQTWAHLL